MTEPVRLSKRMSELGLASRREADAWIEQGWVRVDGAPAVLGQKVLPHQKITIVRAAAQEQASRVTVLINKPIGYVSGQAEDGYEPAVVLVRPENRWRDDRAPLPDAELRRLNHGLALDGAALKPAKVWWQNEDQLRFILREGKKRQIRRMCELVGLKVVALKRIRIGGVQLGDLPIGQWRYLRGDETF